MPVVLCLVSCSRLAKVMVPLGAASHDGWAPLVDGPVTLVSLEGGRVVSRQVAATVLPQGGEARGDHYGTALVRSGSPACEHHLVVLQLEGHEGKESFSAESVREAQEGPFCLSPGVPLKNTYLAFEVPQSGGGGLLSVYVTTLDDSSNPGQLVQLALVAALPDDGGLFLQAAVPLTPTRTAPTDSSSAAAVVDVLRHAGNEESLSALLKGNANCFAVPCAVQLASEQRRVFGKSIPASDDFCKAAKVSFCFDTDLLEVVVNIGVDTQYLFTQGPTCGDALDAVLTAHDLALITCACCGKRATGAHMVPSMQAVTFLGDLPPYPSHHPYPCNCCVCLGQHSYPDTAASFFRSTDTTATLALLPEGGHVLTVHGQGPPRTLRLSRTSWHRCTAHHFTCACTFCVEGRGTYSLSLPPSLRPGSPVRLVELGWSVINPAACPCCHAPCSVWWRPHY